MGYTSYGMIIGVDAGALSITDERLKVGVYRVSLRLLQQLASRDQQNSYRLYTFQKLAADVMRTMGEQCENVVLWPSAGWFSVRLPLELRLRPVDIFLGLSQALPVSSAVNIGFVYDLGFLHHPEHYPDSYDRLKQMTADLVGRSKHIITISQASALDLHRRYHVAQEDITVAYPGVDERFNTNGEVYTGERPYFLFVGSLKRSKNIPLLLRAFARFMQTTDKTYDLYLAGGDFWVDPEIAETIEGERLSDRVKLLGFVDDDVLPSLYRGAVAFVSPSSWEGFCIPAVEAMASGCPVIGSTTGAFPEVVRDAGILIDPMDQAELTRAFAQVIDADRRAHMIAKGMRNAKQFTWSGFAVDVYQVIHEMIRHSGVR